MRSDRSPPTKDLSMRTQILSTSVPLTSASCYNKRVSCDAPYTRLGNHSQSIQSHWFSKMVLARSLLLLPNFKEKMQHRKSTDFTSRTISVEDGVCEGLKEAVADWRRAVFSFHLPPLESWGKTQSRVTFWRLRGANTWWCEHAAWPCVTAC